MPPRFKPRKTPPSSAPTGKKNMSTKTRTKKFTTKKETYAAKIETIRRKEVRNHKQSFNKARSAK